MLGAAVAVELLRALEAAALSDPPTWTGTTSELFSRLHKKGFLTSIPADQAGRAAGALRSATFTTLRPRCAGDSGGLRPNDALACIEDA